MLRLGTSITSYRNTTTHNRSFRRFPASSNMILTNFLYFCFLLKATNARTFRVSQTQAISIAERALADNILNPGLSEASLPSQPQTISLNRPTSIAFVPSPVQFGISSSCKSYYLVQNGDYCDSVVSKFHNFTLNEFYTWNP